jgi:hypothetical protein
MEARARGWSIPKPRIWQLGLGVASLAPIVVIYRYAMMSNTVGLAVALSAIATLSLGASMKCLRYLTRESLPAGGRPALDLFRPGSNDIGHNRLGALLTESTFFGVWLALVLLWVVGIVCLVALAWMFAMGVSSMPAHEFA